MVNGVISFSMGGVPQGTAPPAQPVGHIRLGRGDTLEEKFALLAVFGPASPRGQESVHYLAMYTNINRLLKPKARSDRGRSDSPAVQPQANPFSVPTPNPFTSQSFNFTANQPQQSNGSAYQFGQQPPAPANPPQQNGTNPFSQSQAPTFGGFGASTPQTQPQQNGFNASTSLFNQPSQQSSTPSFGGFGQPQSQPSQQNGTTTPATSFGGFSNASQPSNQVGASMSSNIFNNFGKQQENNGQSSSTFSGFGPKAKENGTPAPSSFNAFGQQTQENGSSRASTPAFSGLFGQKAPQQDDHGSNSLFGQKQQEKAQGNNGFPSFEQKASDANAKAPNPFTGFNGFGQKSAENGSASLFSATQAPDQTPKATATTNMFGQPPSSQATAPSTGLFGSITPSTTTAPSTGLFGSNPSSGAAAPGTGLFGSKLATNEPNKSGTSIFDNLPKKDSSSLKINFSSADPSQVYHGEDDDEDENQAPSTENSTDKQAPSTNIFGAVGQSQQTPKPASNLFAPSTQAPSLFGSTTAQKDANMSTIGATPQKSLFPSSTPAATPATQPPRSLFDRVNKPAPEETTKAPLFSATPTSTSTAKPLFPAAPPTTTSTTSAATPSLFQKPSSMSADDETPKAAPQKNIFAPSAAAFSTPAGDETPRAAPQKNIFAPSAAAPSTPAVASTAPTATFKAPPAIAPVARTTAPPVSSASTSMGTTTAPSKLTDSQQASMKALNEGMLAHLRTQRADVDWSPIYRYALTMAAQIAGRSAPSDAELNPTPTVQPSSVSSSSAFGAVTNAAPSQSTLFAQTPKAAPASSSTTQVPATAPSKKRLFEEDTDEPSRVPATEKRSKPNETSSYPKLPESASNTAKLFASTLDKPAAADSAKFQSTSGFTPATKSLFSASASTPTATPATGGFKPTLGNATPSATASTGGFKPTMPAASAGNSFLSSFGELAKKQEDEDRQKRKDENYDSEEETEEQWAKRDKAEQEEKRRKFEEAAKKTPSFSIEASTPKAATAEAAEKAQDSGDKTWRPESPVKFNTGATTTPAAAPPKFGNLFGSYSLANDASSKLFAPATSLDASRATTPGATTDGEAATTANGDKAAADDGEPSDEPNQPQASDEINNLQPAEREANDVLLELEDVRTSKMEKDEDSGKQTWKPKTRGRFFILKDKSTGKIRMLSRTGAGRTVLNHFANKEATFKVHPKKATMIVASMFVDHLYTTPPGPGQWMFSTPDQDDAAKIVQILTDGTPK
ncbi:Nuclear pore complex protein-like protein [Cercospora zeina]